MDNKDVDVEKELAELLNTSDTTTDGASADNSEKASPSPTADAEPEISERETKRARELADENKRLTEELARRNAQEENWIETIEDEGTRALLKKTIEEAEKRAEQKYSPLMSDFRKSQFEKDFASYAEKFPTLSKFKDELSKEYGRNPNMNLKSKIGEIVVELMDRKITPLETKSQPAPRGGGEIDLDSASKEELYALLGSMKR